MKRILLPLALLTFFVFSTTAQVRFGVKGGMNFTGVSGDKGTDQRTENVTGFYVGPTVEALIKKSVGLETGIFYSQRGIKFANNDKQRTEYIDVPLLFKIVIPASENIKPFFNAGPYVSFKVSGDGTFDVNKDQFTDQWKSQSFGAGLNFGGGVELAKHLQLGVNYNMSMTNNFKASDGNYAVKDRTWSITAGIYF